MKKIKISPFADVIKKEYEGVTLHIAPAGNIDQLRKTRALLKSRGDEPSDIEIDQELQEVCEAIAGTILVGWDTFEMDGEPIEYSEENAASLLFHDPQCREFVSQVASDIENFRLKDRTNTVKK